MPASIAATHVREAHFRAQRREQRQQQHAFRPFLFLALLPLSVMATYAESFIWAVL